MSNCRNAAGLAKGEAGQFPADPFHAGVASAGAARGGGWVSVGIAQPATAAITRSIHADGADGVIGRKAADLLSSAADQRSLPPKSVPIQLAGFNPGGRESAGSEVCPGEVQTARILLW